MSDPLDVLRPTLAFVCALGAGLVAGVFFAFSAFVMTALARLPAEQGIAAMQSINVVVLNAAFLGVFMGTGALALAAAVLGAWRWTAPGSAWLTLGGVLYLVGVIGVTGALNVPWNDRLAAVAPHGAESAALWARYVVRWTIWNHARCAAGLAALAAFAAALRASR